MVPCFTEHPWEPDPCRSSNVVGVGHQSVSAQVILEDVFADRDALFLGKVCEPVGVVCVLAAFYDEGRCVFVELVGVRPDPAFVCFLKNEGEGVVEFLVCPQPDEGAFAQVYVWFECLCKVHPCFRIEPVAGHHHVEV